MIRPIRDTLVGALLVTLLVCTGSCSRTNAKSMQVFLDNISHGPEAELGTLIYGHSGASPGAKQVLLGMLRPLRAPSPDKHMSIEASQDAGRFTMLAVRVPWPRPTQGYGFQAGFQPIIICHEEGRDSLVGYVLPFNDIMFHLQGGRDVGDRAAVAVVDSDLWPASLKSPTRLLQ